MTDQKAPGVAGGRLPALDGIRALAIISVIAFHATSISKFPLEWLGVLATPVVHGWMGVDLFFGMSGFLITRLWLEEEVSSPAELPASRAKRFFGRRALRILPLYYVTLFGFLLLAQVYPIRSLMPFTRRVLADPSKLGAYVLFFVNYVPFGKDGAFAARWSLCVEEHFYLLWPIALVLLRDRRRRLMVAAGASGLMLAARTLAIVYGDHAAGWSSYMMVRYASHFRIDSILWGALAALVYGELAKAHRARRIALAACTACVVGLVAANQLTPLRPPLALGTGLGTSILAAAAALLAAEVTAAPRSWLARVFALQPLPTIGYHSYAMYLVHPLAIDIAIGLVLHPTTSPSNWHWAATIAVAVVVALVAAMLLHWTVERPFRGLRARLRVPPVVSGTSDTSSST